MAWTSDAVSAQLVEFSRAREVWVRPDQCTRRELEVRDRRGPDFRGTQRTPHLPDPVRGLCCCDQFSAAEPEPSLPRKK